MRVTQDMITAMGGRDSDYYSQFMSFAGAAFLVFRQVIFSVYMFLLSFFLNLILYIYSCLNQYENVRLLINSIICCKDSKLPDISIHHSPEEVVVGLISRLKLELSDDDALSYFEELVSDCLNTKLWFAVDTLHKIGKRLQS